MALTMFEWSSRQQTMNGRSAKEMSSVLIQAMVLRPNIYQVFGLFPRLTPDRKKAKVINSNQPLLKVLYVKL